MYKIHVHVVLIVEKAEMETFLSFYITTDVQLHLQLKLNKHDDDDDVQ